MKTINDWEPETRSLLKSLTDAGFTLVRGNNGEYGFLFKGDLAKFIKDLTACDESRLWVTDPNGNTRWLFLVYGNSPGELVSDYSVLRDETAEDRLDAVTASHCEVWSNRKQPTTTRE